METKTSILSFKTCTWDLDPDKLPADRHPGNRWSRCYRWQETGHIRCSGAWLPALRCVGKEKTTTTKKRKKKTRKRRRRLSSSRRKNRRTSITRRKITVRAFHKDCCNLKNASYIISSSLNPCSCCIHSSKNEIRFGGFMYKLFSFWIHHFSLLLREV